MTPAEKIKKIKAIQQEFLTRIETIKRDYQKQIKGILQEVDKRKMDKVKKDLGI
jgi:hypothetical protein